MGRKNAHPSKSASNGVINSKVHVKEPQEALEKNEVKGKKVMRAVSLSTQAKETKKEWRRLEVARLTSEATHQSQSLMKKSPNALFKLLLQDKAFDQIVLEDAHLAVIQKAKKLSDEDAQKLLLSWKDHAGKIGSISKHAVTTLGELWDSNVQQSLHNAAQILACDGRPVHRQTLSRGKATLAVRIMGLRPREKQDGELPYPQNIFSAQNAQCDRLDSIEHQREINRAHRAAQRENNRELRAAEENDVAAAAAPSPDMSDLPEPKAAKPKKNKSAKASQKKASSGMPVPRSATKVGKKNKK